MPASATSTAGGASAACCGRVEIRLRRAAAVLASLVALAVTLTGWLQAPDELTSDEAVEAALDAFAAAGVEDVEIDPEPLVGTYSPGGDDEPVPVWLTSAEVDGDTISLWLARDDGEALYLDDRTPDGGDQLLTDEQVRAIGEHDGSPAVGRQVRRNIVLTVAAALLLAVASRQVRLFSAAADIGPVSPTLPDPAPEEPVRERPRPPRPGRPLVAAQRPPR